MRTSSSARPRGRSAHPDRRSSRPGGTDLRWRGALLMPLGALAVHQLRYYLAFGTRAPARLRGDGHAYLSSLEPFVLLAAALAVGAFAGTLARALQTPSGTGAITPAPPGRHGHRARGRPRVLSIWDSTLSVWTVCALVLLALYCGQELFEGLFASGHPAGLTGVFGHGGWIAVPLSVLIGAGLAAMLKLSQALMRRVVQGRRSAAPRAAANAQAPPRRGRRAVADWRLQPQSGLLAGRAPPRPVGLV